MSEGQLNATQKRSKVFNRAIGMLDGLTGVTKTSPTTIRSVTPMIGASQTFIVQTMRQRDDPVDQMKRPAINEWVFIEYVDEDGSVQIVLPPDVTKVLTRQHDALTTRSRKAGARAAVETRRQRGIVPTFKRKAKGGDAHANGVGADAGERRRRV